MPQRERRQIRRHTAQYHLPTRDALGAAHEPDAPLAVSTGRARPAGASCGCGGAVAASSPSSARSIWTPCWRAGRRFCRATGISISCSAHAICCCCSSSGRLRAGFLISPSVDGELGAMIVRRAGRLCHPRLLLAHRRAGAEGLFQALMREKVSPIITPGRSARAALHVQARCRSCSSQMSGRPMLPLAYAASRAGLVHWDRFVLPLPFSRIAIGIGPAREVAADARMPRVWRRIQR